MGKPKHEGSIHFFSKDPKGGGNAAAWVIGIAFVLILLAAA